MNTRNLKVQKRDILVDYNENQITKEYFEQIILKDHFIIFKQGKKYGFLNEEGKRICEAKYTYVECVGDKAVVSNGSNAGIINSKMEVILPFKYKDIYIQNIDYILADDHSENIYYFDCIYENWWEHELYTSDLVKVIDDIINNIYYYGASILACTKNKVYAIDARTNGYIEYNCKFMFPWVAYTTNETIRMYVMCNNNTKHTEFIYYDSKNKVIRYFNELTNLKIYPEECIMKNIKYDRTYIYVKKDKYINIYILDKEQSKLKLRKINNLNDIRAVYLDVFENIIAFEGENDICHVYDLHSNIKITLCKRKNLEKKVNKYQGCCNLVRLSFDKNIN